MTNFSPGFLPPTPLGRAFNFGIQLRLKEQKSCYHTPRSASNNKDPVGGEIVPALHTETYSPAVVGAKHFKIDIPWFHGIVFLSLKGPSEEYSDRKENHSQATRKIPVNSSHGLQEALCTAICTAFAHSTPAKSHQVAN